MTTACRIEMGLEEGVEMLRRLDPWLLEALEDRDNYHRNGLPDPAKLAAATGRRRRAVEGDLAWFRRVLSDPDLAWFREIFA